MGNLLQLIDWKEKNNREMDKLLSGKETLYRSIDEFWI